MVSMFLFAKRKPTLYYVTTHYSGKRSLVSSTVIKRGMPYRIKTVNFLYNPKCYLGS